MATPYIAYFEPNANGTSGDWNLGGTAQSDRYKYVTGVGDFSVSWIATPSSPAGAVETFLFENFTSGNISVSAVGVEVTGVRTNVLNAYLNVFIKSGNTWEKVQDGNGPVAVPFKSVTIWKKDPDTNSKWTNASANACELGVKKVSSFHRLYRIRKIIYYEIVGSKSINGNLYFVKTNDKVIAGNLWLAKVKSKTLFSNLYLAKTTEKLIGGKLFLSKTTRKSFNGKLSLNKKFNKIILGNLFLNDIFQKVITGGLFLSKLQQKKITGKLFLSRTYQKSIIGNLFLNKSKNILIVGKLFLFIVKSKTLRGKLSFNKLKSKNIIGNLFLSDIFDKTIGGKLSLSKSQQKIISGNLFLSKIYQKNINGNLFLGKLKSETITGNLFLVKNRIKTFSSKLLLKKTKIKFVSGNLFLTGSKIKLLNGNLALRGSQTKTFSGNLSLIISENPLPRMYRPGSLLWGGSDGWVDDQSIPYIAISKWKNDIGIVSGQHHRLFISMRRVYNADGSINWGGINRQVTLAESITTAGGSVTVDISQCTEDNHSEPFTTDNWERYKPADYSDWATKYANIVSAFVTAGLNINKLYFTLWTEPARGYWLSPDEDFFNFTSVVQSEFQKWQTDHGVSVKFGGWQQNDLRNNFQGVTFGDRVGMNVWKHMQQFLDCAVTSGWQIDFWPVIHWTSNTNLSPYYDEVRSRLTSAGYGSTPIHCHEINSNRDLAISGVTGAYEGAERDSEIGAAWLVRYLGGLSDINGVERGDIDFIQDDETDPQRNEPPNREYLPYWGRLGLLGYVGTLPKPKYFARILMSKMHSIRIGLAQPTANNVNWFVTRNDDDSERNVLLVHYENPYSFNFPSSAFTYQNITGVAQKRTVSGISGLFDGFRLNRTRWVIDRFNNNPFPSIKAIYQRLHSDGWNATPGYSFPEWAITGISSITAAYQNIVSTAVSVSKHLVMEPYSVILLTYDRTKKTLYGKLLLSKRLNRVLNGKLLLSKVKTKVINGSLFLKKYKIKNFSGKLRLRGKANKFLDGKLLLSRISNKTIDGNLYLANIKTKNIDGKLWLAGALVKTIRGNLNLRGKIIKTFVGKLYIVKPVDLAYDLKDLVKKPTDRNNTNKYSLKDLTDKYLDFNITGEHANKNLTNKYLNEDNTNRLTNEDNTNRYLDINNVNKINDKQTTKKYSRKTTINRQSNRLIIKRR